MDKKYITISFVLNYIVCFILWPLLNWLWTFIDGSEFVFHLGRNCWIATGFAMLFGVIIPMVTGKAGKGE